MNPTWYKVHSREARAFPFVRVSTHLTRHAAPELQASVWRSPARNKHPTLLSSYPTQKVIPWHIR